MSTTTTSTPLGLPERPWLDAEEAAPFLFVAAHLRAEVDVARHRAQLYHLRQEHGRDEIDLLAEVGAEQLIGIESRQPAPRTRCSRPSATRSCSILVRVLDERQGRR